MTLGVVAKDLPNTVVSLFVASIQAIFCNQISEAKNAGIPRKQRSVIKAGNWNGTIISSPTLLSSMDLNIWMKSLYLFSVHLNVVLSL